MNSSILFEWGRDEGIFPLNKLSSPNIKQTWDHFFLLLLLNSYIFIWLHFKTGLVRYFKTMKLNWNLYSLLYDWDKFLGYVFLTKEIKYKFIWEHPGYARRQIMFSKKKLAVILCKMLCGNSYLLSFCRIVCTEINVNLKVRVAHCLARVALKSSLCCFNMGPINVFEQRTDMN